MVFAAGLVRIMVYAVASDVYTIVAPVFLSGVILNCLVSLYPFGPSNPNRIVSAVLRILMTACNLSFAFAVFSVPTDRFPEIGVRITPEFMRFNALAWIVSTPGAGSFVFFLSLAVILRGRNPRAA